MAYNPSTYENEDFQGPIPMGDGSGDGSGFLGLGQDAILPGIGLGLQALSGIGHGIANRRMEQNANTLHQDDQRANIDRTALAFANYNRQDPGVRAGDAVQGDILAGVQPVTHSGSGKDFHFNGGLTPALLSQGTRNYGQLMSAAATGEGPADPSLLNNPARQAMLAQLRGDYGPRQQKFTQPSGLKKAGLGEKLLSIF
jgi:hypothetical protein